MSKCVVVILKNTRRDSNFAVKHLTGKSNIVTSKMLAIAHVKNKGEKMTRYNECRKSV